MFEHAVLAFEKLAPGTGHAVQKARAAGVPILVIVQWIIQYGPSIVAKIEELIALFQQIQPIVPPAPAAK